MMFSIIMPVYNNETYFPLAVASILEQEHTDFELIIVDDGSTDGTPELADALAASDCRIRVIHQQNQWIYASFNNGIRQASGDYIYIVNSDDRLMPGALSLLAAKAREYHPDIIWTKVLMHVCDADQKILEYDKKGLDGKVTAERYYAGEKEVHKAWPYFFSSNLASNQANLYRREIMQAQPFRNDVYGADMLYNISIADRIRSALVLPEPVYAFYVYSHKDMNESLGKYYPYTGNMYTEIYGQYRQLFQKWELPEQSYGRMLCTFRMSGLTFELQGLQAANCPLTLEEKLQYALCGCVDDTIRRCVQEWNGQEELESRILSAIRELLLQEPAEADGRMHFVREMLESLLRYEKTEEDYEKIRNGVYHCRNPFHTGKIFYEKLSGSHDSIAQAAGKDRKRCLQTGHC